MSVRIRTGYSFREAVGHINEVAQRLADLGFTAAPITDTASTFGFVKWSKLCKKFNMKPVFGLELAVTDSINAKKPVFDNWCFLAINSIEPLNELLAQATNQFRYRPLITYDQANAVQGCFKIVGHKSNLDLVVNDERTFIALAPSTARGYFRRAKEKGFRFASASDNKYTDVNDQAFYEITIGRNASLQTYPQHILSHERWATAVSAVATPEEAAAARQATEAILSQCNATLQQGTLLTPAKPQTLREMCEDGAQRLGIDLSDPVYAERLDRELKLIDAKKFEDYFYIISDACRWARERMIVGPARGSSCGSLVCFLLEITTVDPIPYGLIFERFIDINRNDLPDIDIDFSDNKRQLVFDYIADKYGKEHVARLGTVALYKPRSALQDTCAALDIPRWKLNPVLDSIVERSSGDSRALQAIEDTLNDTDAGRDFLKEFPQVAIAGRMEGHPSHNSQHAAGIVLTEHPVREYVAVDSRTGATHCDKKDAEDLNLLKIDALGLKQLSVFEDALAMAGLPHKHLESIDLNDQKAFDILNKGHFSGIFQFNGLALQSITQQVPVTHLEDIISITALGRPGPLNTGGTHHWIQVKNGKLPVSYPHPLFEPALRNTLGVVAYQEQVMVIGREIGDLSWEDVTALRKAMSKSLGKEFFDKYGDKWKANAIKKGVPEAIANKVWDDLCAYGSWAFNRSHAVAYGIVSYWCCWLKAHYPLEFAAATLSHSENVETQIKLLREMASEGIDYIPVDPDISTDAWTVGMKDGRKCLVGPLSIVKGIGPKMVEQVLSARCRQEPMPSRAAKLLNNPTTAVDSLFPIGDRFKKLMPDPRERNIFTRPTAIIDCQVTGFDTEVVVFVTAASIKPKDENEQINVAKRGYKLSGPTQSLNLRLVDDTDAIFAKVDRFKFEKLGKPIVERGRPGKALYAVKGTIPPDFRMIKVTQIKYIGDMEKDDA